MIFLYDFPPLGHKRCGSPSHCFRQPGQVVVGGVGIGSGLRPGALQPPSPLCLARSLLHPTLPQIAPKVVREGKRDPGALDCPPTWAKSYSYTHRTWVTHWSG